jgi:hypothetical protein
MQEGGGSKGMITSIAIGGGLGKEVMGAVAEKMSGGQFTYLSSLCKL